MYTDEAPPSYSAVVNGHIPSLPVLNSETCSEDNLLVAKSLTRKCILLSAFLLLLELLFGLTLISLGVACVALNSTPSAPLYYSSYDLYSNVFRYYNGPPLCIDAVGIWGGATCAICAVLGLASLLKAENGFLFRAHLALVLASIGCCVCDLALSLFWMKRAESSIAFSFNLFQYFAAARVGSYYGNAGSITQIEHTINVSSAFIATINILCYLSSSVVLWKHRNLKKVSTTLDYLRPPPVYNTTVEQVTTTAAQASIVSNQISGNSLIK